MDFFRFFTEVSGNFAAGTFRKITQINFYSVGLVINVPKT